MNPRFDWSKSGRKRSYWQGHIYGWWSSNLTQNAYCDRHGLSLSAFHYWKRKFDSSPLQKKIPFIPVSLDCPSQETKIGAADEPTSMENDLRHLLNEVGLENSRLKQLIHLLEETDGVE